MKLKVILMAGLNTHGHRPNKRTTEPIQRAIYFNCTQIIQYVIVILGLL
jgi:hypothetical protein